MLPAIPGTQLTIGQETGNLGALGLERALRNTPYGRAAFLEQEARNDVARVAALEGAAPAEATLAARNWALQRLKAMQAAAEGETSAAGAEAGTALESAGVRGSWAAYSTRSTRMGRWRWMPASSAKRRGASGLRRSGKAAAWR